MRGLRRGSPTERLFGGEPPRETSQPVYVLLAVVPNYVFGLGYVYHPLARAILNLDACALPMNGSPIPASTLLASTVMADCKKQNKLPTVKRRGRRCPLGVKNIPRLDIIGGRSIDSCFGHRLVCMGFNPCLYQRSLPSRAAGTDCNPLARDFSITNVSCGSPNLLVLLWPPSSPPICLPILYRPRTHVYTHK